MSRAGRRAKRAAERALVKEARGRLRAARRLPGGSPLDPLAVPTPAVVEGEAEAIPCPACGGKVRAAPHAARVETDVVLRTVRVVCGSCHVARDVYFRVARPLLN